MAPTGTRPIAGAIMGKKKQEKGKAASQLLSASKCRSPISVDRIDLADRFEEACAQALGIASLLIEADADVAVQNSAAAVRDLIERIRNIGRILIKS